LASAPDADVKLIREDVKSATASGCSHRHSLLTERLQATSESSPGFAETLSELAFVARIFGPSQTAACHYRKAIAAKGIPFWPESPALLEVVQKEPRAFGSSFEVIASALSGILRCPGRSLADQVKDVRASFSKLFANCRAPEHWLFARLWVRLTALQLVEALMNRDDTRAAVQGFAFLALTETTEIWKIRVNPRSRFLSQVPPEALDQIDFLNILQRVFRRRRRHRVLLRSVLFAALVRRGDIAQAAALFDGTSFDYHNHRCRQWGIETASLVQLFDIADTAKADVAPALLASTAPEANKHAALRFLSGANNAIQPQIALSARLCVASFVTVHDHGPLLLFQSM
jgi:hypothetical protein